MDINQDQEKHNKANSPTKNNGDRSRDSCKRCHRRKKSRNNDGSNDEAKEPTKDVEKNGSIKCHSHTENDSAMKDTLELENESCHFTKKRGTKKDALNEEEKKRLSMMAEEEEEDEGITIKVTKS